MERRTVFLFGQSMLLSLLANSLKESPDLSVVSERTWAEVEALSAGSAPDVVIYDLSEPPESAVLTLLHKNPRTQLIGLDAETNRAVLIAGQETRLLTLGKVKEIVGTAARQGSPQNGNS
jgi:hypothetical protein